MKNTDIDDKIELIEVLDNLYDLHDGQRRYKWKNHRTLGLVQDIEKLANGDEESHFIGTIEVSGNYNKQHLKVFSLIDGQQRLSTILIIFSCIKSILDSRIKKSDEHDSAYLQRYSQNIREILQVSKIGESGIEDRDRLIICGSDQKFFHKLLFDEEIDNDEIKTTFQECLKEARDNIYEYLFDFTDEKLMKFTASILHKVLISVSISKHNENPYETFNSLNAKKEDLTDSEALQNLLFEKISSLDEGHILRDKWENMINRLNPSKNNRKGIMGNTNTESFLKHYLMSKGVSINKKGIFKYYEEQNLTSQEVCELIEELDAKSIIYMDFLQGKGNKSIQEIYKMKVKQVIIVILALDKNIKQQEFEKITWLLECIAFSCIMGGIRSNTLEAKLIQTAKLININNIVKAEKDLKEFLDEKKGLVLDWIRNTNFVNGKKAKAKYILSKVAYFLDEGIYDTWSLEHILVEKKDEDVWKDLKRHKWFRDDTAYANVVSKIGNLSLITIPDNSAMKKMNYVQKKQVYEKNGCKLTSSIAKGFFTATVNTKFDKRIKKHPYVPTKRWTDKEIKTRGDWIVGIIEDIYFNTECS